jgi:protein-tyrosine phosphatase
MALPVMHTAVGVAFAFLAGLVIFLKKKKLTANTLILTGLLMVIFGIWAEVPDIPRFFPRYERLERKLHKSSQVNIFFFHGLLDTLREDRGELAGSFILFSIFFSLFAAAGHSVLKNEKELNSLKNNQEPEVSFSEKDFVFKDIVDIHCHVLAGVDDGPDTIEDSLAMCKRAVELGVAHIVATPHLPWQEKYEINKIIAAYDLLKGKLKEENIALELSLGADIRIDWDLLERLKNSSVFTVAKSRYFLLELDNLTIPPGLEDFITRCNKEGFYPVLTHPERNILFCVDYERINKLSKLPLLIQVSSCSLTGSMGTAAKKAAFDWLKAGLVDLLASDAHAVNVRLEEFRKGLAIALKAVGPKKLERMIVTVPAAIVHNQPIEQLKQNTKSL